MSVYAKIGPVSTVITWSSLVGLKRPRREADYSLTSSAEVGNDWSYISTPPIRGVERDITFTFTINLSALYIRTELLKMSENRCGSD